MPVTTRFRELLGRSELLAAMGGYDALSARLIERAGGEVVYMSGSSVSTSVHGYPDVGLTTMTEIVDRVRGMVDAVDVPVFCDADTGYGNPINVRRTVEEYERAGVAGIHIEDQTFPKKCGHFEEKGVVPTGEMAGKSGPRPTPTDEEFVVIARTDAVAVEGFERAVERAEAYREAGTDALFVEATHGPRGAGARRRGVPGRPARGEHDRGGKTPLFTASEFEAMGYDVVLYPATGFKAAAKAMGELYEEIAETGTQRGMMDRLVTWEGRNEDHRTGREVGAGAALRERVTAPSRSSNPSRSPGANVKPQRHMTSRSSSSPPKSGLHPEYSKGRHVVADEAGTPVARATTGEGATHQILVRNRSVVSYGAVGR